ncbi:hypothetical protein [Desulfatitalea alkaliphila]|uniref:Uncharacterized protein n=1 Tax=Desulfatitalea alkaliphila TaxID=2929485 RepID=A0AA41R1L5_9BACT|nr:hypothetical protein [Desulfatitalea alkaliphila]MCJ8501257.1 hypothetical protein [Desulfatitalea alkaliphila]
MKLKSWIVVAAFWFALIGCGGGGGDGGSGGTEPSPVPVYERSLLVLEATSLEFGAELHWNEDRFPGAVFNVCLTEEHPESGSLIGRSQDCFSDRSAMVENDHVSPVTVSGLTGGHRYWVQVEAETPSGQIHRSRPVIVSARIPDEDLLGIDDWDWQRAPDLAAETQAISRRLAGFQQAARNKDIHSAVAFIQEDQRDVYQALFSHNPDAMPAFGVLLDRARMGFLSPPAEPAADSTQRTAEYALEIDGFTFYVRWMKHDDTWMLMDF